MSNIRIDPEKFQESITRELEIVKDRVRNLIGGRNWAEEGRYKEAVLRNVIKRFLPSNLSIGTGFIVKRDENSTRNQILVSKQIDIIVYDNRKPILFSEGDFIITTNDNVKAIIEVKTKIENSNLRDILLNAINNSKLVDNTIFSGIFAYEYVKREDWLDRLKGSLEQLRENGKYVNHICLGPHIFVKYWERNSEVWSDCKSDFYGIYDFNSNRRNRKISFSYFISNLIYHACDKKLDDRLWFLFPVRGGKEQYRVGTACLGTSRINR